MLLAVIIALLVLLAITSLLTAITLRRWIAAAAHGFLLRVFSIYTRLIHYASDEAACDVLVLFRDPTLPHIDLSPFIAAFEDVEIIDVGINYALPLDAMGHAIEAKQALIDHYMANPSKRYTLLGFGVGGYAAAYCATSLPQETLTYATTLYHKQRARALMVGTPVGGFRSAYNATIARAFFCKPLRSTLTIGSRENSAFWDNLGPLRHAYFLIADNDLRTSPSRQAPPLFSTAYVETRHCTNTPWFGLCSERNVRDAIAYLWNPTHTE